MNCFNIKSDSSEKEEQSKRLPKLNVMLSKYDSAASQDHKYWFSPLNVSWLASSSQFLMTCHLICIFLRQKKNVNKIFEIWW